MFHWHNNSNDLNAFKAFRYYQSLLALWYPNLNIFRLTYNSFTNLFSTRITLRTMENAELSPYHKKLKQLKQNERKKQETLLPYPRLSSQQTTPNKNTSIDL